MKRLLSIFILILSTLTLLANGVKINGVYYLFNGDSAEVTYTGVRADYQNNYTGDIVIPDSVNYGGKFYRVTSIGYGAFENTYITSIKIPQSVKMISFASFRFCKVTSVEIPSSVDTISNEAFLQTQVRKLKLNEGLKYIGKTAFRSSCIDSLIIPTTVKFINEGAFAANFNLTYVKIPYMDTLGSGVFQECENLDYVMNEKQFIYLKDSTYGNYIIPEGIERIEGDAFYNCLIDSVEIPSTMKYIGRCAFFYCKKLRYVKLNCETPPYIYYNPWEFGTWNKEFHVPCGTTESYIQAWKQDGYNNFTFIEPEPQFRLSLNDPYYYSLNTIRKYTCYNDTAIFEAKPVFGHDFVKWNDGSTDNPRTLVVIKDTVIYPIFVKSTSGKCGDNLYWTYQAGKLTITGTGSMYNFIEYPSTYSYSENTQPWYYWKDSIKTVSLPEGLTSIGTYAFNKCKNLESINIPQNVTAIGDYAFSNCKNLRKILCYANTIPSVKSNTFNELSPYTEVYVKDALFEDYKFTDIWRTLLLKRLSEYTGIEEVESLVNTNKIINNGNIYIIKDNHTYLINGANIE